MCCLACIRYLQLDCDFNYSHFYLLSYYQYTAKCMNQLCCNWADLLVGDSSEIDLSYKLATLVPVLFGRFSYILWLLVCVCVCIEFVTFKPLTSRNLFIIGTNCMRMGLPLFIISNWVSSTLFPNQSMRFVVSCSYAFPSVM